MASTRVSYDVLICGAGPAGMLIGIGLQKMGIGTCILERLEKSKLPMYGRACTLYPRTLEYLDQYDLLAEMEQVGLIARNSVNYKDGERVVDRGWHVMFTQMGDSFLRYVLNIRLKYSEDIFATAYKALGGKILTGVEMTGFDIGKKLTDEYATVNMKDLKTGENWQMQSRLIVGADGAKSVTREIAGITSTTQETALKWVRIDAIIKTDMPDSRIGFASLESKSHGNVLWVSLDHGRSRIGFALTPEMQAKYGSTMTEAQVIEEAKASMLPFDVEFVKVDWFTVYGIRQSVANHFIKEHIILAGDACHSHSSGTAQGMNTGVHDAVNLAWKIAGVLKGQLKKDVLYSYEVERRAAAKILIDLDRTYSALITGHIPKELENSPLAVNDLLTRCWDDAIHFNIGLGVSYAPNILNVQPTAGVVSSGHRLPDVQVYRPGSIMSSRLYEAIRSPGVFHVVVFAGEPLITRSQLVALQDVFGSGGSEFLSSTTIPIKLVTIIGGNKAQSDEALGVERFGRVYYDYDHSAHMRYGMSMESGGVVVARPDAILGFACRLEQGREVMKYFGNLKA